MLAATRVNISDSEKKVNKNTYDISSIKRVTRKFLEVSGCSVQNNGKEMYKKSVLHVQSCFFANQTYCCFSHRSCCLRRLALHDFVVCLSKLSMLSRASLLALAKSIYIVYPEFSIDFNMQKYSHVLIVNINLGGQQDIYEKYILHIQCGVEGLRKSIQFTG